MLAEDPPQSIVIAGAGAIGIEFAYVLHTYGVQVTIVEFLDRAAPFEDAEVSAELAKQYRKLGIDVLTSTRVESIAQSGHQVRVTVTGTDGARQVLEADKVLQAIGVAANVTGDTAWRTPVSRSRSTAPSTWTSAAVPPFRTSAPSVTSPRNSCSRTPLRRWEWSPLRRSPARRPWSWTTS